MPRVISTQLPTEPIMDAARYSPARISASFSRAPGSGSETAAYPQAMAVPRTSPKIHTSMVCKHRIVRHRALPLPSTRRMAASLARVRVSSTATPADTSNDSATVTGYKISMKEITCSSGSTAWVSSWSQNRTRSSCRPAL